MLRMLRDFWTNRKLIWKLAKNDFKTRYAGSYFGVVWAMVQPVVIVLVYWFVFQIGLNNATAELKQGITVPFVLWLVSGIVPWFYFSESLSNGTNALLEYNYLVKKVVFNIDILPLVKTIAALFIHAFFVLFMLLLFALYGYYPGLHTLQLIYTLLCITVFSWGLGYLTSSVIVFVRDLGHLMTVLLQVLMWMTPIMWPISLVQEHFPWLVTLLKINPLFYVVQCSRDAMTGDAWFWEHPLWTLYFWVVTVILFVFGAHVFQKLRAHFADVL